jgi:hypothetical protein
VPTGAARAFLTQGCLPASLYGDSAYGTVNTSGTLTGELGNIFGFTSGDANAGDTTSRNLREIETLFDPIYQSKSDIYQFNLEYDLTDDLTFTAMTSYSKGKVYTKLDYNRNVSTVRSTARRSRRAASSPTRRSARPTSSPPWTSRPATPSSGARKSACSRTSTAR